MRTTPWPGRISRSIWSWWRSVVKVRGVGTEKNLARLVQRVDARRGSHRSRHARCFGEWPMRESTADRVS